MWGEIISTGHDSETHLWCYRVTGPNVELCSAYNTAMLWYSMSAVHSRPEGLHGLVSTVRAIIISWHGSCNYYTCKVGLIACGVLGGF